MIITRLSRHIMTIVTVSLMVTMQERRFSQAATICNTSCNTGLIVDMRTCTCVPNISCDDPSLSDPPMCETIECDLSNQSICPKKCLCSMPSPLTNYCEPCYNDGVLDKTTCKCTCPWPYQGPQCEYAPDPCAIEDDPAYCSQVNCYNATQADFFYCQRKCLCCKNKQCDNLGSVEADCSCTCMPNTLGLYDASRGCALVPDKCGNDQQCFTTLGLKVTAAFAPRTPDDCNDMQKVMCPLACKLCTAPIAASGKQK